MAENMVALMMANGVKKAAALVEDSDYGVGIAKNLEIVIERLNAGIEFSYDVVERATKDFVPILLKYKTQVQPEVLIAAVTPPGGFLVLKQAHEIRFAPSAETVIIDGNLHRAERQGVLGGGEGRGPVRVDVLPVQPRASS